MVDTQLVFENLKVAAPGERDHNDQPQRNKVQKWSHFIEEIFAEVVKAKGRAPLLTIEERSKRY